MKKTSKLKICDWSLLFLTIIALVSGIQLEATHSRGLMWVWLHIILCSVFMAAIVWHLYLHFRWQSWLTRLRSQKSLVTRWLAVFWALTFITAIASCIHWLVTQTHAPIGGFHGKAGFVFIALAIVHTVGRIKFFKNVNQRKTE